MRSSPRLGIDTNCVPPKGWDTPSLCTNQFVYASHNVCSELSYPGLPSVRNVQAYFYKMLCERMPDPFLAWGKLGKDPLSFSTEHYNTELCVPEL